MNEYISELLTTLRSKYSVEVEGMTTSQWLETNTTHKGHAFSFKGYEFQRAIVDDLHPDLDVMKISQVGLTEVQMRKATAILVRTPNIQGIFSLPNADMYTRFSQSRLIPYVKDNRVFAPTRGETRSMNTHQFGSSFLNIVNATEGSATSIPADFVFNDEVDMSDQKILALFASRLQNSKMRMKQRFSTPTWNGFGIDATYSGSDQREYMIRCHACRQWQTPLWDKRWVHVPGLPESVALDAITPDIYEHIQNDEIDVHCETCGAALDLNDTTREWVATYPSRTASRGYRVRPFSSANLDPHYIIGELLNYQRRDFLRGWYNTVIGEPYTDSRSRLQEGQIRQCFRNPGVPEISSTQPVFLGIDIGYVCHMALGVHGQGDKILVFEFRAVRMEDVYAAVQEYVERYNLVSATCDRHPQTMEADRLREETNGVLMPLEYRGLSEFKPVHDVEENVTHWQGNRTMMIDQVARRIRMRQMEFAGYGLQANVIVEQLRDMIREETAEKPAEWVKLSGNDHYFHALGFLVAAMRLPGIMENISTDERRSHVTMSTAPVGARGLLARRPTRFRTSLV